MSKVDIRNADMTTLDQEIRRDRHRIEAGLSESSAVVGRGERERLRWILAADRAALHRQHGARDTAELLAGRLHVSKWRAARLIAAAHAIENLPHIAAALEVGSLSLDKTVELTRFATSETEKKLVRWARRVTVGCIRQRGDEAARVLRQEIQHVHHNRDLQWWKADHTLYFEGHVPIEQGVAFVEAVDRLAHELPADPGSPKALFDDDEAPSIDQRRADALMLLVTSGGGHETATPTIHVHVSAEALANDERNGVTEQGDVLAPELVRMLACDSRIQGILDDPDGHPLGAGTETRFPSRDLRRAVLQRDGHTCTFPGCGMKRFLHTHHIEPWPHGKTEYWNLITVCQVHHSLVHKLGWTVTLEDGHATWLRPRGLRFEPGPAPPDPPPAPLKTAPSIAQAAGYSRMFDLIKYLARAPANPVTN